MALHNPSNLYTGGAVVFNEQPFVNFATNLMAKKQAKEEALDKYFGELGNRVTSTGMREQEVQPLIQAKNNYQNFYIKNRDAIQNPSKDGGRAYGEAMRMINEMNGIVNNSKALNKTSEELKKIRLENPDLTSRMTEGTLGSIGLHEQPSYIIDRNGQVVKNPEHQTLDLNEIIYNPKELNQKDWNDYYKGITTFIKPDKTGIQVSPLPGDKYSQLETTTVEYSPQKLKAIGDLAKQDFSQNKSLRYSFEKSHNLLNTPIDKWQANHAQEFNELNDIYKKAYGKDANIQDESDLHAAQTLKTVMQPSVMQKRIDNFEAKRNRILGDQKTIEAIRMNDRIALKKLGKDMAGSSKDEKDNFLDSFIDQQEQEAQKTPLVYTPSGGVKQTQFRIPASPLLKNIFSIKDGTHLLSPDEIRFLPNGNVKPIFYQYDDAGNIKKTEDGRVLVRPELSQEMSRLDYKAALANKLFPTQQKIKQVMGGKQTKTSNKGKENQVNIDDLRKKYNY